MKKTTSGPFVRPKNGLTSTSNEVNAKQLLKALMAFKRGDFSARLPDDWTGVAGKIADTFNEVIANNQRMTKELDRIGRVVGKEGRITQRASLGDVSNSWADAIGSVNGLIGDLVHPTSEMARVIGAVAKGDLSQNDGDRNRGPAAGRRIFAHGQNRQHDGRPARRVRLGSDARGARSRAPKENWAARRRSKASPAPGRI